MPITVPIIVKLASRTSLKCKYTLQGWRHLEGNEFMIYQLFLMQQRRSSLSLDVKSPGCRAMLKYVITCVVLVTH